MLSAQGEHRLDGQSQSLNQARPTAGPTVVGDIGAHVHFGPDAVTGVVLDDSVTSLAARVLLDGVRDVTDATT